MELRLVVGLGNPGPQYEATRHNAGFMAVDRALAALGMRLDQTGFGGAFAKGAIGGRGFVIGKPMTFMNLSGAFVANLCRFYKISAQNVLVAYDDFAFDLGRVKARERGSAGGHNGMASVIACLGTEDIKRIRIGIGPAPRGGFADFVLGRFAPKDSALLDAALERSAAACRAFLEGGDFAAVAAAAN